MNCPHCGKEIPPHPKSVKALRDSWKGRRKITAAEREEIRASGLPRSELAKAYGVGVSYIGMIQRGER